MLNPEQELALIAAARNAVRELQYNDGTVFYPAAAEPLRDILANIDETPVQRVLRCADSIVEAWEPIGYRGPLSQALIDAVRDMRKALDD